MKKHRPTHLYQKGALFFITGRTYGEIPHLIKENAKDTFKEKLSEKAEKHKFELKGWVILNNHYHLLAKGLRGRRVNPATPSDRSNDSGVAGFSPRRENRRVNPATPNKRGDGVADLQSAQKGPNPLSKFIGELHGSTSFLIKKLPPATISDIGQIAYRKRTPMDDRIEKRLERIISAWSSKLHKQKRNSTLHQQKRNSTLQRALKKLTTEQIKEISNSIKRNDTRHAKFLLSIYLDLDVPFWNQYIDHIIRNEKDYYMHLNYIHQNPVKHGLVEDMWNYKYSSIHGYERKFVGECFEKFPIVDFEPRMGAS